MDDKVIKCFQMLGLPYDASINDVETAYQRLRKDIQNGSLPWEKSKEILWAYDYVLNFLKNNSHEEAPQQTANETMIGHSSGAVNPGVSGNRPNPSVTPNITKEPSRGTRAPLFVSAILIILFLCIALFYFGRPLFRINSVTQNDLDTASIVRKIKPSIVILRVGNLGTGSGFVVDKEGYIVTNAHVMKEKTATATFSDGFETEVNLVMLDEERDFALVKAATNREYAFLTLGDSTKCSEGDTVIAAGAPLSLEFSFTKGIIRSTKRSLPFLQAHLIQTDAAINPGNSGGPLVNTQGEVVGVNFFKVLKFEKLAVEGIGFAIAINDVKAHIEKKQQMSDVELTQAMAREMKIIEEVSQAPLTEEIKKMKEQAIEEQWERERRRRELNEKVEVVNKDLQEQKQRIEKRLQEEADQHRRRSQETAEARNKALNECLQRATNQYQGSWNEYCKKYNQQDNCSLPYNAASLLQQRLGQWRDECIRLYPQ